MLKQRSIPSFNARSMAVLGYCYEAHIIVAIGSLTSFHSERLGNYCILFFNQSRKLSTKCLNELSFFPAEYKSISAANFSPYSAPPSGGSIPELANALRSCFLYASLAHFCSGRPPDILTPEALANAGKSSRYQRSICGSGTAAIAFCH
jgi:hypothetical protein